MAECTNVDLRKARDARNLTRWEVARSLGIHESTVERWEKSLRDGGCKPTPEDVDRLGELYGDPDLWHRWMLSNCEPYRRRYMHAPCNGELSSAIMRVRYEGGDVAKLQELVERASLEGNTPDNALFERYSKEIRENIAAQTAVLQLIGSMGVKNHDENV